MPITPANSSLTDILQVADTACVELALVGSGTKQDPAILSAKPITGGSIVCTENGLEANICVEGHLSDDGCSNIAVSGSGLKDDPIIIKPETYISPDVANLLSCSPGGLLATFHYEECNTDTCVHTSLLGVGSASDPLLIKTTLEFADDLGLLTCSNGLSAQLHYYNIQGDKIQTHIHGTGTNDDPLWIQSDLVISNITDNTIECAVDGLYVASYNLEVLPDPCVSVNLTGDGTVANPWVLKGELHIDQSETNLAVCTASGLYVAPPRLHGVDTHCIETTVEGDGTAISPFRISSTPQIAESECQALECTPTGLYVEDRSHFAVLDSSTLCLDLVGTGKVNDPKTLGAHVKIDPNEKNLLGFTDDGLIVLPTQIHGMNTDSVFTTVDGCGTTSDPWVVSSEVYLNALEDNLLEISPLGLTLSCESVKECVGLMLNDSPGLEYNPVTNSVCLCFSDNECNQIGVDLNGCLFVPPVQTTVSNSLVLSVDEVTNTISGDVRVSSESGNQILLLEDGLYSSAPWGKENSCFSVHVDNSNGITVAPKIDPDVRNAFECRDTGLFSQGAHGSFSLAIGDCLINQEYRQFPYVARTRRVLDGFAWSLEQGPRTGDVYIQVLLNGSLIHTLQIAVNSGNNLSGVVDFTQDYILNPGDDVKLAVTGSDIGTAENFAAYFEYTLIP